jgi:hypothetical protein
MRLAFLKKGAQALRSALVAGVCLIAPTVLKRHHSSAWMETPQEIPPTEAVAQVAGHIAALRDLLATENNAVIVLDSEVLVEVYQEKMEQIIKGLERIYPGIKVVKVTRDELFKERPDLADTISQDSFFLTKTKLSPEFDQHDHYTVFMRPSTLQSFFEEIPKVDLPDPRLMDKFTTVLGTCEGTNETLSLLKKLSQSDELGSMSFADFKSCASFGATPADLILLKKNSKSNSFGDKFLTKIDGNDFDMAKINQFFAKNFSDDRVARAAKTVSSFSVFTPAPMISHLQSRYIVALVVDHNKISSADRKKVLQQVHDIAEVFAKGDKDDVAFVYRPSFLKKGTHHLSLIDQEKQNLRLYYKMQNQSRENMEKMIAKYPFLVQDLSNTFVYRFDINQELTLSNFKAFFEAARDGKAECHRESGEPGSYKCSKRLVRDNFRQIFEDGKDHVVFFHSPHCHMCGKVSAGFEAMAIQNLVDKESRLEFNRINNDKNTFYSYAPVIAYFKAGRIEPFIYQSQFFTEKTLESFVNVMKEVSLDAKYPEEMAQQLAKREPIN